MLLLFIATVSSGVSASEGRKTMNPPSIDWPAPTCYPDRDDTVSCNNGILQIRPSRFGIIWFDFYHRGEDKWYIGKNNLNLMTLVPGTEWQNTELNRVVPSAEPISQTVDTVVMRYRFAFPNGARIYADMSLKRGAPEVTFDVYKASNSPDITGFQFHVTFGQAEAVDSLSFGDRTINTSDFNLPLPGGREEVQHHEFIRNVNGPEYRISGQATNEPDPNNPSWMSRVLGLKQRVTWAKPMRPQDHFAYEIRDVPWQPGWGVPKTRPWVEGLWFIRNGEWVDGDRITYTIDNLEDYLQ